MSARSFTARLPACLLMLAMAFGVSACSAPKYYVYDEFLNKDMQAKVAASKNVWVLDSDYNADIIIIELKSKGYTIDNSKAEFSMGLRGSTFRGLEGKESIMTLTFAVYARETGQLIFCKVGVYTRLPTNVQVREFVQENLAMFQGQQT